MSCNADIEGEENAQYSFTSQGQCVEIPNCPPSGEETGYKSFNTVSDTFCDGQCEHTKDPNGSSLGDQFYYGACPSGQQDECTWQRYDSISTGNECETTDPVPDENSTDDDQDGVPNDDDECEATPTDGQGVVDEYGCLVDDPNATPDPSASPSPSPTASPTASPNPSGSPEPTGSPQPTGSPAPSGSPSPTDGGGDEGGGDGGGGDGTCDPQLENCGTGEEGEGAIQVQGKSARTIGESIGVMGTSLDNSPLMQSFDSISVPSSAGTCPTAELALFNDTYSMDAHCGIIEENRALFAAIMLAVWGMVAVYIVMRA